MEHASSKALLQPRAFIPGRIRTAIISLQWRSPSVTMWHRSLPKPLGRSLRHSLLKSLLTATAWTWPNASAPAIPYASTHATATALAYAYATACSYAHACSYAPAYATWELWLRGLWPNATAKQMSTEFWTSDGSSSWPNCNYRLRSLRQRYAHLWGSVKWMDAREQLDDQTLASAARTHAYAHA